jgi:predicted nucleic acid-binding protein
MIVVADTSPLNYLILIEESAVLPDLFGKVLMPLALKKLEATNFRLSAKLRDAILRRLDY